MARRYYEESRKEVMRDDRREEMRESRGYSHRGAETERPEEKDGMIHEDRRAIANLPQEVMIKPYAPAPGYLPDALDDTIEGVDRRMEENHRANMRGFRPNN
jgi:IMP dehydrogenase/GMP reductase